MKKQLAVILALSATLGISSVIPQAVSEKAGAASTSSLTLYDQEKQALIDLNEIRKTLGLQPLTMNSRIGSAASSHATFLDIHGPSYGRHEVKGMWRFTGELPGTRIGPHAGNFEEFSEVQAAGQSTLMESINTFMDTAYQRAALLTTNKAEIGLGMAGKQVVIDIGKEYHRENVEVAYPYDGQKNVGIDYYGKEEVNPLKQFGIKKSGYVISYAPAAEFWLDTDKIVFTLVDSKGTDVPVYKEEHWDGTNFYFPKETLKYNETYTASISYEDQDHVRKGSKTWSFTTKAYSKPKKPAMKAKTTDVIWKGRILINKANVKLYTSKGKVSRKLKKNEVLKVAVDSSSRYALSDGSYVMKSKNVTYYLGRISSNKGKMVVYTSKGKVYKKYNANLSLKVYGYSNGKFDVGNGRYVKDATNLKYAK